ncbi:hypothetical protein BD410DRAFT_797806 [Rickenella mellea]|uniref:F-box domain-containing protein n=1 Tax=Rickenella mellea TaxID=50990 RepID=A0A4R5XDJ8_9AGAM|nr:hypothetical protein BD410DRAFT_797806 [Rickenella mellea]
MYLPMTGVSKRFFPTYPFCEFRNSPGYGIFEGTGEVYPSDHGPYIYSKWDMPSLTSFEGINVMPRRNLIGTNVTECKLRWFSSWLEFGYWGEPSKEKVQYVFMSDLTRALQTLQSLQHLELHFDEVDLGLDIPASPLAVLSNLKSLTLTFGECTSADAMYELMTSVSTPHLENLHVMISINEGGRDCARISSYLEADTTDIFLNLKRFSLEACDDSDWYILSRHLLYQSPSLVNLTIQAPFEQDKGFVVPEDLQTLRFEKCNKLSESRMMAIYQDLLDTSIKRVEIIKCSKLSREFISKLEIILEAEGIQLVWEV